MDTRASVCKPERTLSQGHMGTIHAIVLVWTPDTDKPTQGSGMTGILHPAVAGVADHEGDLGHLGVKDPFWLWVAQLFTFPKTLWIV